MKKMVYLNMGQDDPKTGWKEAANIAISKGITHLYFSCGHWTGPNFMRHVANAYEFSEAHPGFTPVIGQHLFAPGMIQTSVLVDPVMIEKMLLIRVDSMGKRYESGIDVEPQSATLRRLKSASIGQDKADAMRVTVIDYHFTYALPELCGPANSMYRIFPVMGKYKIAEQTYRKGVTLVTVKYPIDSTAVIGLAVVPNGVQAPDNEYTVAEAMKAYLEWGRFFYPVLFDAQGKQIATLVDIARSF